MKKKAMGVLLVTLLCSNALPIASYADELTKESFETSEQSQVETGASESITQESSSESKAPISPEQTQDSVIQEKTEPSNETVGSVEQAPVLEAVQEAATQESVENEVVIPVEPSSIHFSKETTTEEFVARIGDKARDVGKDKNLFASVMIAQAILESGSGSSQLSQEPYNNLFGIKGDHEGQSVSLATLEDDGSGNLYSINAAFRMYPSYKESFEDYSKLFTDGVDWNPTIYKGAWKSEAVTYENATQALTGTYATDTLYNQKLNGLIETYNLTQFDREKDEIVAGGDFEPYNNANYDTGNSYAWGNCTQYVYNRITQLGGHVDLNMGNGQDWGYTGVSRGYEVSNTPKAGTAVSFPAGVLGADPTYGHVAFVEHVNEDRSILISEMNAQGLNVVSTRTIQADYVDMLTYITPK